jgi:heme exporter protein D
VDLGPHTAFILAAYAMAVLVIVALVAWIVLDHRAQKRALGALETRGVTRRSDRTAETTA